MEDRRSIPLSQERRAIPRQKSFLQGRVFYNNRRTSVDCIIRDITESGARLKFADTVPVPQAFELHIPNKDETFHVRVIWNHGQEMGVVFDERFSSSYGEGNVHTPASEDLTERVLKLEREVAALRRRLEEFRN